jgi:hypothetical protein
MMRLPSGWSTMPLLLLPPLLPLLLLLLPDEKRLALLGQSREASGVARQEMRLLRGGCSALGPQLSGRAGAADNGGDAGRGTA